MSNNLNLRFGKLCFSISFFDKEMENAIKHLVCYSLYSRKQDYMFKIGYFDRSKITEDWKILFFEGERWYFNINKARERHIFFPKNETIFGPMRVLLFLFGEFYKLNKINGKRGNDFLIHGAGLVKDGKGYVFTGPSGAGKTTISQLSIPDVDVLSDESIVVSEDRGLYSMSQGPIKNEITSWNGRIVNLTAIFIIVQDKTNSLRKLSGTELGLKIMEHIIYVDLWTELKMVDAAIEKTKFVNALCSKVPVYELRFKKDISFWREIELLGLV